MKAPLKITSILAAFLAATSAFATTSDVVGYVTSTINGSSDGTSVSYTTLSAVLENPISASGSVTTDPTSAELTDSNASNSVNAYASTDAAGNASYYLQITSGVSEGLILDIDSNTATTFTTGSDLTGLVSSGDTYVIKEHMTLSDIFGATNTAGLKSGGDSGTSDLVYIMSSDGNATYAVYYYQTDSLGFLGGTGWRVAGDSNSDMSNVVVGPDDGLIVARSTIGDLTVTVPGSVNSVAHSRDLPNGYSLVSYPFPVDVTLADSGVYTATNGYQSGGDSVSSDLVYVLTPNGVFNVFYRQTDSLGFLGGDGWRAAGDSFTSKDDEIIPAGSSIIIQHKGSGLAWSDPVPFSI